MRYKKGMLNVKRLEDGLSTERFAFDYHAYVPFLPSYESLLTSFELGYIPNLPFCGNRLTFLSVLSFRF
jgi:hypothetical protein